MNIELRRKTFVIVGLRGTGKSTFANYVCSDFGKDALVYDTLGEAPDNASYDCYVPRNRNSASELDAVINAVIQSRKYQLFVIDEANRFAPSKPTPLPPMLADLNDQCRHYGITVGYIARRPVQLNQDLTELSDYIFCFHLKGKNDIKYLDNLSTGLGDAVLSLTGFQYVMVMPDRSYRIMNPIVASKSWLDASKRHLTNRNQSSRID